MSPKAKEKESITRNLEQTVHVLFKNKGQNALEIAKKVMLTDVKRITFKQAREAMHYFVNEYWNDLVSPTLISLGCEAVGGNAAETLPIAVPMILINGAVDIHDDIIDESTTKYDRPTIFGKYGKTMALLIGDALLFKGYTLLQAEAKNFPQDKFLTIIKVLDKAFFELGDAEASELQFRDSLDISSDAYLAVMQRKAADVEGLFHIGAIIGNGSNEEIEALCYYGRIFGLLSILKDDWIDMFSYKELNHRMKFESLPLPLLYALQNQKAKREIAQILRKKRITRQDTEKVLEITERYNGFKQTKRTMIHLMKKTRHKLVNHKIGNKNLESLLRFTVDVY
jgi:geranylgeranyl pyrophosphate synthase